MFGWTKRSATPIAPPGVPAPAPTPTPLPKLKRKPHLMIGKQGFVDYWDRDIARWRYYGRIIDGKFHLNWREPLTARQKLLRP